MGDPANHSTARRSTSIPVNTKLGSYVRALLALDPSAHVLGQANAVANEIVNAMNQQDVEAAAAATTVLVQLESETGRADVRREFGISLRRVLTDRHLHDWAKLMVDPFLTEEIRAIMVRAGVDGTHALLQHLTEAQTIAERRVYFEALCATEEGAHLAIRLFDDERWFVIRNVAELAGEMRLEAAIPALGVAMRHEDSRVRQSAVAALAQIGTSATEEYLRAALTSGDRKTRLVVARAVQPGGSGALAMPLLLAASNESDPSTQRELYLALGRLGSADAIQALVEAAAPGGRIIGRRSSTQRVSAIQGLRVAGGKTALATLAHLQHDRDRTVRAAAITALRLLED